VSLGKAGPYELLELLGEGGVGQVYSARDTLLGRQVAIKTLRPELSRNREFIARFYGEAQRLGELNHANITTLYALHLEGDQPFMVMELVRGATLRELLGRIGSLPPREALAVLAQAAAGLSYAHHAQVIHRDIKPSNLMATDSGIVKIMDFGIARMRGSQHLTRAGQAFLTPLYASPEQIRGEEVDERSDLYSLAIVVYEMLAGRPPFTADTDYALSMAHLETPPPPLAGRVPGLDPRTEAALLKALAKRPEERFASVEEFGSAAGATAIRGDAADILQAFLALSPREAADQTRVIDRSGGFEAHSKAPPSARSFGSRPSGSRLRSPPLAPRPVRRWWPAAAAALGAIVIVLAAGAGYWWVWVRPGPVAVAVQEKRPTPPAATRPQQRKRESAPAAPAQPATPAPPKATAAAKPESGPTPPLAPKPMPRNPQTAAIVPPKPMPRNPQTAAIVPPKPMPPAPAPAPPAPPTPVAPAPPPKPDLEGVVSGAMSASRIEVAARFIDLYGIEDPTTHNPDLSQHLKVLIGLLAPAKGRVECYRKPHNEYQCYTGGKDLALLALRRGVVRLGPDPPPEYREAAPARKPVSDRMQP
jgi:eukaryotic-like serine/threonine-protein kinase